MRPLAAKIKPASGFSHLFHQALTALLPLLTLLLVRLQGVFVLLALALVLLSKWRMLAVKPRFWPAMIRANSVDLLVGFSLVLFMAQSTSGVLQIVWTVLFIGWLLFIKPASGTLMVSIQALIAQTAALMALFLIWADGPLYGLVIAVALICYLSARHFFDSFNEPYARMLAYIWSYFSAALMWLLGHWLIFYYGLVAQPTLILSAIGYSLAVLYYFDHNSKLSVGLRRQFVFIMIAILIIIIAFADWGDKVV